MLIKDFFTQSKNELSDKTNIYVCGPTVYDYPHIGNMRPVVVFDVLNRLLQLDGEVDFTHNITDIDDKIIKKSIETGKTEKEISEKFTNEYLKNLKDINVLIPNNMPKVTDNVAPMVAFIQDLVEKGFAYEANGSVYFEIEKLNSYGEIANLKLEELKSEESFSQDKRSQLDFALWKSTTEGIQFESPWGMGRPGWHTECAFFVKDHYGTEGIDLHGGGIDLKFPHHINEMAQYFAATNNELAKNWAYVGHLHIDSEKMSKSEGNIIRVNDFVLQYSPNILRVLLTQTQYSKPVNVNDDSINNAGSVISKIENLILKQVKVQEDFTKIKDETFISILKNDLDTPNAFAHIFEQIKNINASADAYEFQKMLFNLDLLGIKVEINEQKVKEYQEALTKEDFERSDILRKEVVSI